MAGIAQRVALGTGYLKDYRRCQGRETPGQTLETYTLTRKLGRGLEIWVGCSEHLLLVHRTQV